MGAILKNRDWEKRKINGRKPKFSSPEQFWERACEYFEHTTANPIYRSEKVNVKGEIKIVKVPVPRPFTVSGLCSFLDISRRTLGRYEQREDFRHIITRARDVIFIQQYQYAVVGVFDPRIIARSLDLRSNY